MIYSRLFAFIYLPLLVFIMFFHQIDAITQDLGRHLLLGQIIVQTGNVPRTNLLSYTNPDSPFINTHWLSEVIFYLIQNVGGFFGLLIITSLIATSAFIIQLMSVKNYKIIPIIIASLLYLQILLDRTDIRPEIFSFLFLSIYIVVLYKYRKGFTKWIYILPFIEFLWVNIHIYFPIGLIVLVLFLLDMLIIQRKKIRNKHTLTLGGIIVASAIATLFNPNIIHGATYPLFVFQNYGFEIAENHSVFTIWRYLQQKSAILYFFISVPILFSVLFLTLHKTKTIDWLLAISFTIIAASAERNLPLFVFATFIAFVSSLDILYTNLFSSLRSHRYLKYTMYIVLGLFIIWQTKDIVTFNSFGYAMPQGASKAVDFLEQNNIRGPILNNFDIGSYLAYRLYPKEKVFVDGRPEAYPASFFQNYYIPIQQNKSLFQQADNKYHFNVIFMSHADQTPWAQQFLRDLNANPQWRLVYLDPLIVLYIKNTPQSQKISSSILHAEQLTHLNLAKDQLNKLLLFYENIGWTNEIKEVDRKLLELDPNSCFALSNMGTLLANENDQGYVVYATRYQSVCH